MSDTTDLKALSRRQVILAAGCGALVASGLALAPRAARATPADADSLQAALIGDAKPIDGKVSLRMPKVPDNGASVPFTVSVDSPMTEEDHVKSIHILAEGNPAPAVASYHFTPASGRAEVSGRMRLAQSQNVRALAMMSDGSVYQTVQNVTVTIGGCGG
ncbi:thiosulfate oxidation carrier protein SoxY [Telmatospirillum sp. J64-1]|uniref:thiosulfate oxidation carrier protein SoxY n=1 Tax=Telmatospirillum sp. J64-1 TaxID=2502183 RepID=UPI00115DA018|nr:thiosulfate oxidation carrier protein SoxY [Telmatospirillum sp. J64-1]